MSGHRTARIQITDPAVREAVAAALVEDGYEVLDEGGGPPPRLHLLVVDAPVPPAGGFTDTDVKAWYDDVHAAVSRPFREVRSAAPALRRAGDARVVVVGAGWLPTALPRATAAAAAHGALVALVKTLARDLGPEGVTVNEIVVDPEHPAAPGDVARTVAYLASPHAGAVTGQLVMLGRGGELRP